MERIEINVQTGEVKAVPLTAKDKTEVLQNAISYLRKHYGW